MKTLPTLKIWTGDGFSASPIHLLQLERTDTTALYERRSENGKKPDGFEVIIIKKRLKGQPLPGGMFEEEDREVYPSANQFGKLGWHIRSLELATKKFKELSEVLVKADAAAMVIPTEEFTTNEFAEENEIDYIHAANFIKESIEKGTIKYVREERRNAKGKPSKIFSIVS